MELKDFVAATLTQICEGIQKAQNEKGLEANIAPPVLYQSGLATDSNKKIAHLVHFEVTLSAQENASSGNSGGLNLKVLSGGINAESSKEAVEVQRVSFDIPVVWPSSGKEAAASFSIIPRQKNLRVC